MVGRRVTPTTRLFCTNRKQLPVFGRWALDHLASVDVIGLFMARPGYKKRQHQYFIGDVF